LAGFWLRDFLSTVLDRYTCVQDAIRTNSDPSSIGLDSASYVVPQNYLEFHKYCADDPYNLQLWTGLLDYLGIKTPKVTFDGWTIQTSRVPNLSRAVIEKLLRWQPAKAVQ